MFSLKHDGIYFLEPLRPIQNNPPKTLNHNHGVKLFIEMKYSNIWACLLFDMISDVCFKGRIK